MTPPRSTVPLGTCSALGYVWRQHAHVVEIDFEVGLGSAGKVSVDLAENAVLVGIENRVVISGMLQRDISVNESSWQEKEMSTYVKVTIKLVKALPMLLWDYPVRGPHPATGEMDGQSELEVARFYAKNGDRERCLQHTTAAVAKGIKNDFIYCNIYIYIYKYRKTRHDCRCKTTYFPIYADVRNSDDVAY